MRIAVISDTHLQVPSAGLLRVFERHLSGADALLHCGDIVGEAVLDLLHSHPSFHGVRGNMDCGTVAAHLPLTRVVTLSGLRIGMVHNPGQILSGIGTGASDLFPAPLDLVCCGHIHQRMWMETAAGIPLLNPGSLAAPRDGLPGLAMVGWDGKRISLEWIDYSFE